VRRFERTFGDCLCLHLTTVEPFTALHCIVTRLYIATVYAVCICCKSAPSPVYDLGPVNEVKSRVKPAFHDTDTDILARILARKSRVSNVRM